MMKKTALLFALTTSLSSLSALAEDKYDYMSTPEPNQIADLLDDDNDGVINARDLCPETPLQAEIDNDGCGTYVSTEEKVDLHILFANDSSKVQPIFLTQIRQVSEFLELYPSTSIELQGYASKVGSSEHNLALSQQRAEAVRQALAGYGTAFDRIDVVGFGDSNLTEQGDDEVTHAMNRKVVATVIGYKGNVKKEWDIFTTKAK